MNLSKECIKQISGKISGALEPGNLSLTLSLNGHVLVLGSRLHRRPAVLARAPKRSRVEIVVGVKS